MLKRTEPENGPRYMNKLLFYVFYFVGLGPTIRTLAQACLRLRDVALSSSTLWSVIGVCTRLVPQFLQSSMGWPLQVRVVVARYDGNPGLPDAPTGRYRYALRRLLRD
jgi:hypothetical protein